MIEKKNTVNFLYTGEICWLNTFGATNLESPGTENYHCEDYMPLIDCGDAGPDRNEIFNELFAPFNLNYDQLQETFIESVKRHTSVEIAVDPRSIRPY